MRSLILLSSAALLLGLGTATSAAAPTAGLGVTAQAPTVTLVEGWWEQESHADAADKYWQLSPRDRRRYDAAEARIQKRHRHQVDHYDKRDDRDLRTEHHLLHY